MSISEYLSTYLFLIYSRIWNAVLFETQDVAKTLCNLQKHLLLYTMQKMPPHYIFSKVVNISTSKHIQMIKFLNEIVICLFDVKMLFFSIHCGQKYNGPNLLLQGTSFSNSTGRPVVLVNVQQNLLDVLQESYRTSTRILQVCFK